MFHGKAVKKPKRYDRSFYNTDTININNLNSTGNNIFTIQIQ